MSEERPMTLSDYDHLFDPKEWEEILINLASADLTQIDRIQFPRNKRIFLQIDGLDEIVTPSPEVQDKVTALVKHVAQSNGVVVVNATELPPWISGLHDKLSAMGYHWPIVLGSMREVLSSKLIPTNQALEELGRFITKRLNESPPIEIYIDPGNASKETLQELFEAISDLHVAAGGLGLEFKTDGNSVFQVEGVEQ